MATGYRVTMKSEEQRGASQPNIIFLDFASDADANTFGGNAALICSAINVSNDVDLSADYSLPYPAGTDGMTRSAITDGIGHWMNVRVYDTPSAFNPVTRAAALIASGFQLYIGQYAAFYVPTAVNIQQFNPGPSIGA